MDEEDSVPVTSGTTVDKSMEATCLTEKFLGFEDFSKFYEVGS